MAQVGTIFSDVNQTAGQVNIENERNSFIRALFTFNNMLSSHFQFKDRHTSLMQEIRAGFACFLTMSYILLVNPQVLSQVGISATDIVISTSLSACVSSVILGVFG